LRNVAGLDHAGLGELDIRPCDWRRDEVAGRKLRLIYELLGRLRRCLDF